ncbi:MAG: alpha/beta fold hydrolase [Ilumatobacteraceae bacterium]
MIVHGAWGGGWEWSGVARLLRKHDHEVFTPTLTAVGERSHLGQDQRVGLATHVQDIVALVEFENLRDVVMCGASYGGMPVTGAADKLRGRLRLVIYVDALVPRDGQSALDLLPVAFGDMVRTGLDEHGPHWRTSMPGELLEALIPAGSIPDHIRADYVERLRDHPAASLVEPVHLDGAIEQVRRAFVRCKTAEPSHRLGDPIEACAARARSEGWPYRELAAPHDPQLFDPTGMSALLEELAQAP